MNGLNESPLGATFTASREVTRELTVAHFVPHMPEVYGTPFMIILMESAAARAVESYLKKGWVTVGTGINISHLAATPLGLMVTATATVVSVDGNEIHFSVSVHDEVEAIGEGKHVRRPIEVSRFMKRVNAKKERGS